MPNSLQFLTGGGEMGELIRSFDWSKTSVGSPDTWPQSLRIAVNIMLDCPFGMYIAWGNDYIQLYNDGYRPILGSTKHPQALGISTRQTFAEIWPTIGPMFEGVMQGTPVRLHELALQLDRNGFLEECFFDCSYSPLRLEDGDVGGVLVTVIETTEKVKAAKALEQSERRFQNLIREANVGIIVLSGEEMQVEVVNEAYGLLIELKPVDLLGKPLFEMIPHAEEYFRPILDKVRLTGESIYTYDQPYSVVINGKIVEGYLNVVYQAYKETDGTIVGVIALCQDITDTVKSRKIIEANEKRLEVERKTLHDFFTQAPAVLAILKGPEHVFEFANPAYLELTGNRDIINKTVLDALPETAGQGFIELLDNVYKTGKTFIGKEMSLFLDKGNGKSEQFFLNFSYQAFTNDKAETEGILVFAYDVTELVLAKTQIEISEKEQKKLAVYLKLATDSANVGTWLLDIKSQKLEWSALHKRMWGYDEHCTGLDYEAWYKLILPADKELAFKTVEEAKVNHIVYDVDYRIKKANDGTLKYIHSVGRYYYNDEGEAETFTGISVDITEQKKAALQLKASEEKYRGLFESIDQGLSIVEMIFDEKNKPIDYRFIENNTVFQQQTGLPDVSGKTAKEVIPDLEDFWFETYGNVSVTGNPIKFTHKSDALNRWFDVYAFKLGDKTSEQVAILFTNITERKQAEENIKESEKQFRTFADSIQNLAWIANADGWIYWYNQRWYDYTGKTLEEMEGWGWQKVHHPDHVEKITALSKELWKKDDAFELTFPLRRHDGEYRWFLTRAYPVKNAHGNTERWIGTNTDIHEQKKSLEQKDEFISIASHEMKTPLTTAKGYLELLLHSLGEENEFALYATKAIKAVDSLNDLVAELLDASKIQNGQLNYNISKFDFNKMVDETIENMQHMSKNHRIQKNGYCLQQITGDRGRLQQVLTNLLTNAVKYSPNADKVLVTVQEQEDKIQVSVHDFGVGMCGKHLNKIFERYYRVEEHAARFQGLGVGLYISSSIIQRHAGRMWAASEPDKGSTFYFTLPL